MDSEYIREGSNTLRIEGWERRLNDYLESMKEVPFEWGKNDCTLFASQLSIIMINVDYMADFRGKYTNEEQAKSLIASVKDLKSHMYSLLEPIDLNFVRRGDLVMYQNALGICNGSLSYFMTEKHGRVPVKTSKCDYAWKVGL